MKNFLLMIPIVIYRIVHSLLFAIFNFANPFGGTFYAIPIYVNHPDLTSHNNYVIGYVNTLPYLSVERFKEKCLPDPNSKEWKSTEFRIGRSDKRFQALPVCHFFI